MIERSKVLLVDDNRAEAELTKIAYKELAINADVIYCKNGEHFLGMLHNDQIPLEEINYILMDMNMPPVNGTEVLKVLSAHENWRFLPVIIFTSSDRSDEIQASYQFGAKAYVIKPLDMDKLYDTIQYIHNFWGKLNLQPVLENAF